MRLTDAAAEVTPVEFRILGPLEVTAAGAVLPLGGPRHRQLLALLLLHAGTVISVEHLIEALWAGRPPASAAALVHVRVSELRSILRPAGAPAEALQTRRPGYVLAVQAEALDARRFERLAAAGRDALARGDPGSAAARLREALGLWRGPAYAELADHPSARAEISRLEELRLQVLQDRVDADLAVGGHAEVAAELEALVAAHPLRERLWARLMLVRYRVGRQADALAAYQTARDLLVQELGVEPGAVLRELQAAILRQDPALDPPAATGGQRRHPPTNLPAPLTGLVGREHELAEVGALLAAGGLVTVTGAGGVGKSRLALAVATTRAAAGDDPDGVWLVELAALADPDLVVRAVAGVLGVHEHPERPLVDLLVERLGAARALLVLDNCEHLLDGVAPMTQRLLSGCPRLKILATSRQRLGITGEVVRPINGLGLPPPDATGAGAVGTASAVRLFVERASAVQAGFELSDATAAAVAQICRHLDGLPLAIELAAAGMSALGVEQIAARLDNRFGLLTQGSRVAPARHQTLRAVVEWSDELLTEPERRLFARLGVFAGRFTLEAAEQVCAQPGAQPGKPSGELPVADLLTRLVEQSLVRVETAGAPTHRYRLLDTLRAYALERLEQHGATDQVRARHASYCRGLAEAAAIGLRGTQQGAWLDRLEREHDSLRSALAWSLERGDAETAARLAGSLYPFWDLHGHYREGRRWLDRVLAMQADIPLAARARVLNGVATLAAIQGDPGRAIAACEQAATLSRGGGYAAGLSHALQLRGLVDIFADDLDRAEALLEESLRIARTADPPADLSWEHGWALLFLGALALARGEPDRAVKLAEESHAVLNTVGDPEGLGWTQLVRAGAAWAAGEEPQAAAPLRAGLRAFQTLDGLWGLSIGLVVAAHLACTAGRWQRSARLLGAAAALRDAIGAVTFPFIVGWTEDTAAAVAAAVGPQAFERARQEGQTLSQQAAIDEAMQEIDDSEPSP